MQRNWTPDIRRQITALDTLTPGNQLLLAYQFNAAKEAHPEWFTMDVYGQLVKPAHGYAVGMTVQSLTSVGDALDTLARLQDAYGFRNLHLGFWRDVDGAEYIDVAMVTDSFEMAERLGITMEQKAIWDFGTDSAIRLDYQDMLDAAA